MLYRQPLSFSFLVSVGTLHSALALPALETTVVESTRAGRALSEDDVYFRITGYDGNHGCLECLSQGGAVFGKRIDRPRTSAMKEAGITHDRYEFHDGDFCLPRSVCEDIRDVMDPDRPCFQVKDEHRFTLPAQICNGHPHCDPHQICGQAQTCVEGKLYPTTCGPSNCDMPISGETCTHPPEPTHCDPTLFCGFALTCFDGKLYPTTCGPNNCDAPISETCSDPPEPTDCNPNQLCGSALTCFDGKLYPTTCGPNNCDAPISETCPHPPKPTFEAFNYGTCQSHGLLPITDAGQCWHAANELHYAITSVATGSDYGDVVDGCSVRTQSGELFHNTQGTCNSFGGSDSWAFRGCQCSDLNPCLCKWHTDVTECPQDNDPFCFQTLVDGQCHTVCA